MSQGEASQDVLFLARGQADVLVVYDRGPEARVRRFGPGTMIGEIGFLLDTPRTATVRAITECEVLTLTHEALQTAGSGAAERSARVSARRDGPAEPEPARQGSADRRTDARHEEVTTNVNPRSP